MNALFRLVSAGMAIMITACGLDLGTETGVQRLQRNVVVLILDTTRADHLGVYGYPLPTSPNLDRLADEGEVFTRAFSVSPWTLPSIATILTGQPPWVHGAGVARNGYHGIHDEVTTVAERVAEHGIHTAAFANVSFFNEALGMARGFQHFDRPQYADREQGLRNMGHRDAAATTDSVLRWAREHHGQSFFLVVHYFDPHLTYAAPEEIVKLFDPQPVTRIGPDFGSAGELIAIRHGALHLSDRQRKTLVARYDAEIRFMDKHIGRLRSGFERLGVWRNSLVIVVGDHGEEFFDHGGFEHGHSHYVELMRVPLIIRLPDGPEGVRHDHIVQLTGLAAAILKYLGVPIPATIGDSLLERSGRVALAAGSLWGEDLVSARSETGTVIWRRDVIGARAEVYGPADPSEHTPLSGADVSALDELLARLQALPPSRRSEPGHWSPKDEELEQLEALGYVQ